MKLQNIFCLLAVAGSSYAAPPNLDALSAQMLAVQDFATAYTSLYFTYSLPETSTLAQSASTP